MAQGSRGKASLLAFVFAGPALTSTHLFHQPCLAEEIIDALPVLSRCGAA
jgi:hypothetical protein